MNGIAKKEAVILRVWREECFSPTPSWFVPKEANTNYTWIDFFSSYLGGIIGGIISGLLTLSGVYLTIHEQRRKELILHELTHIS